MRVASWSGVKRVLATAVVLVASAAGAAAEPVKLDLPRSLELARRHSRALQDRRDEVVAAEHRVLSARARLLPQLKLSARYSRLSYVEPPQIELPFRLPNQPAPEPITLGESVQNQYGVRASLEQPVFTGFALIRGLDAARDGEALARARLRVESADVEVLVEEAYLGVLQARELLEVARDSVRVLEAHAQSSANLRAQGQVTRWEQDLVNARLSGARAQLLQAESAVRLAKLALVDVLGLEDDVELQLEDVLGAAAPLDTTEPEVLVDRALGRRPELDVARAQASMRRAQAGAARSALWPQLRIAASYGWEQPNPRYFPLENVMRDSWDASALLQWTVLDFGATSHAAQALDAEARVAERAVETLEARIRMEVERRASEARTVTTRVEAANLAVSAAEGALVRAQTLCAEGQASCTRVLEAELELTRARSDRTQALANARLAAVRLKRSTGGTNP